MAEDSPAARLTSAMLVGALVKRVNAAGGFAMILAKGDAMSGVILVQVMDKGRESAIFERVSNFRGGHALMRCGPPAEEGSEAFAAYAERRRRSDPDLWLVELDIADAERFAAETIC
ncbi:DUF1491 family protein [Sphingobium yanoikuyae]|uniref:DUF1491 family protein n=1 Tax=Sphingobium yanoikuyae TaxID=13690 RepID=UPI0022DDB4C6|nr:DUF1491 family protein [Sphingobium yanoikuyae]WBQ15899.1 DUF1491 family protein [Sphingobium yanoikuyae]